MKARMTNPALVIPEAREALMALKKTTEGQGVPEATLDLVELRASQLNGCSACVDMHWRMARKKGESDERLFSVAAWREAPFFSDSERAALSLAESMTRLADQADAVPDHVWDDVAAHYDEKARAALIVAIANINVWNRLNVAVRQPVMSWG
ncbi:MAG TPA: carboxymuconolactone decarboxylase family protein [Pinirhizobacter sp.]|uniref:carboxymuconolactone decarboxylase family protein n=1 Tax=Pinirhizobacter sp. TaxID=2950432 RepID=UPI002CF8C0CB|nr:carboxymuconolactone decarboxylase family protein [Pinirhizobacter sp.]HMH69236.1 carboxymuconolactone decarboxylase family protein [Pinirhizobacter sp.]